MLSLPARKPRRVLARTMLFGTSALLAAGLLTSTPTATTGWNQGAAEGTLWQLLNGARANNGMAPLQSHGTLIGLARWRSSDMLAKNYFSHTIAGCGCEVYAYYDANGLSYVWGGENIGWNSGLSDASSPISVHENFMASAGHRANVLNAGFTHGGVGAAATENQLFLGYVQSTRMYTELFLQARVAAPAPAPAPARPAAQPAASQPRATGGSAPAAQPAPANRTASAPATAAAAAPDATPATVTVAAPRRPVSTAGLDGQASVVWSPSATMAARLQIEEASAARAAAMQMTAKAAQPAVSRGLRVAAPLPAHVGVLDGFFGAVIGFIFG